MDRKAQLSNVSFGGAWSEEIAGNEILDDAMLLAEQAERLTLNSDLRKCAPMRDAISVLAAAHPKCGGATASGQRRASFWTKNCHYSYSCGPLISSSAAGLACPFPAMV